MDMNLAPTDKLVRATIALIDDADETQPTLNHLGEKLGVSPFHLQRTFKKALGVSPPRVCRSDTARSFQDGDARRRHSGGCAV